MDWLNYGKKRIIYQEFLPGTGGDIFANLCGTSSAGTIGVGPDKNHKQIKLAAPGLNLPQKRIINGIQHFADAHQELPVMANFVLVQLLSSIGTFAVEKQDQYWDYFEAIKSCHSVWASQHPGGNDYFNQHKSWFDMWRKAADDLSWDIVCLAPKFTTYESFTWTVRIVASPSQGLNMSPCGGHDVYEAGGKTVHRMQNWKIPNYVKTYDHIDLVINDKKQDLLDLVSEINHDIDIDCFNNYYDTYRKIRMRDWHNFVNENKSTLDHWWSKALEENLV